MKWQLRWQAMALSSWYAVAVIWIGKVSQSAKPQCKQPKAKWSQAGKPTDMLNYANLISMNEWSVEWMTACWGTLTYTHTHVYVRIWLTAWLSKWLLASPREAFKWRTVSTLIVKMRKCAIVKKGAHLFLFYFLS